MIKVTLLSSGLKRLLNPAFIQEVGNYHCDRRGAACAPNRPDAEVRNFVLMSGGHDPIDVVETPSQVGRLMAAWTNRQAYNVDQALIVCVQVSAEGEYGFVMADE